MRGTFTPFRCRPHSESRRFGTVEIATLRTNHTATLSSELDEFVVSDDGIPNKSRLPFGLLGQYCDSQGCPVSLATYNMMKISLICSTLMESDRRLTANGLCRLKLATITNS